MKALRVGLVGAGSMGANHARVIAGSDRARLSAVIDPDAERAAALADEHDCRTGTDLDALGHVDAVVLASPTASHVELAVDLLTAGLPVLVEKPVAVDPDDVAKVLLTSARAGVPVTCGFVERFNPVVATCLSMLQTPVVHLFGMRHSPAAPRIHTSVVFDLLIHDLDLALRLGGEAATVHGVAAPFAGSPYAEVADCSIRFTAGSLATVSASRVGQRKIRSITITTEDAVHELDLLRQDLSVYRHVHHEQVVNGATSYRAATTVDIPFIRHGGEPLALQLDHFCDLVEGRADAEVERASLLPAHQLATLVERAA